MGNSNAVRIRRMSFRDHKFVDLTAMSFAIVSVVTANLLIFLSLYNNLYAGTFILAVLVFFNIVVLVFPTSRFPSFMRSDVIKASAISCLSLWMVFLALELAFPLTAPKEYSEIVNLSHRFIRQPNENRPASDLVFVNPTNSASSTGKSGNSVKGGMAWHSPGQTFIYYGFEPNLKKTYENHVLWNSRGYFDREYAQKKISESYRIVVIGDSYVESVQVPLDRTFHRLLEIRLNSGINELYPKGFEVLALGSSGSGQKRNFVTLSQEAALLEPDMVVMTLCSNDICDDDPILKKELDLFAGSTGPFVRNLVLHGYYALAFASKRFEEIKRNRISVSPELLQWTKNPPVKISNGWTTTLNSILESKNFCESRGISFLLVYVGSEIELRHALDPLGTIEALKSMGPGHEALEWDFQQALKTLRSFSENNRINFLCLQDSLNRAQEKYGLVVFGDHYSFFGHEVVASLMECVVRKLLTNSAPPEMVEIEQSCMESILGDHSQFSLKATE